MKGILIEPGKEPVVTTLPDTLQGIEALLRCPCEQKSCHAPRRCCSWAGTMAPSSPPAC